ncbi:hypothetical protein V6N12_012469 [Hibiscus sabdariffa]|uniref:NB-ARC domain-containing protein n=1 Tax=Hibiscus sabdariffa TaxID=183260 RepID=A0ABR1ZG07_9ROSI
MGGVGKTSIMKLINNQLLKETGKFDIVIWITVSKEMSIAKLQKDITSKIGVAFCGDEDETTRAGMLLETLMLRKSRFVMILDDLWEKVSLERIGIPEPFVGRVEPITRSIAKQCAGLPLGVITIASCMRGIDDICKWRNALTELSLHKKSVNGLKDEVFQQLRFSYDRLKDQKLQECFLTCALYPEDGAIREGELIQLWIAEGVMEEMDGRQAKLDRGHAIMNRLVRNCLLEVFTERENERIVKMHDLLRDMALDIAGSRFMVKSGMMLEKAPDVQDWGKDLEKVSLMRNWGLYIPSEMTGLQHCCCLVVELLTSLLLSWCEIVSIPEGFFTHMEALEVLGLSDNPIKSLPHSLSTLKNLTSLLLVCCKYLENVPLSNLRVLKKLDLGGTKIKEIPRGMENLMSLEYLNLGSFNIIKEIPNGILSRLCCLCDLIVGKTLISGKEVGELKKLENLKGRFKDWDNLNMYLQVKNIRFSPGSSSPHPPPFHLLNSLKYVVVEI